MSMRDDLRIKLASPRGGLVLSLPSSCWSEAYVQELKLDGVRESCEIGRTRNYIVGRNKHGKTKGRDFTAGQTYVDQSAYVPHLRDLVLPEEFVGTLLDGEVVWGDDSSLALSTAARGKQTYFVFDCLFFKGRDVRNLPFMERRRYMREVVSAMRSPLVVPNKILTATRANYELAMRRGYEGTVFKLKTGVYGHATHAEGWWKAKGVTECSAVVLDVSEASAGGSPKAGVKPTPSGAAAQLSVGLFDSAGRLREIGKVRFPPTISSGTRRELWVARDALRGRVVELTHSGYSRKRIRWGIFRRFRQDIDPRDCTFENELPGF